MIQKILIFALFLLPPRILLASKSMIFKVSLAERAAEE